MKYTKKSNVQGSWIKASELTSVEPVNISKHEDN